MRAFLFAQDGGTRWIIHYQVPAGVDPDTLDHDAVLLRIMGKKVDYEIIEAGPWTGGLALVADRFAGGRNGTFCARTAVFMNQAPYAISSQSFSST